MKYRLRNILFLGFGFFGIWGCSLLHKEAIAPIVTSSKNVKYLKNTVPSYYIPMQIAEFNSAKIPCLTAKIGRETVSMVLDTGFRGMFSLSGSLLDGIEDKVYLYSDIQYGIRGTSECVIAYDIPQIDVGRLVYSHPVVSEISEKLAIDAELLRDVEDLSSRELGCIGWQSFWPFNLFLDLGNARIGVSDSLGTLQQHEYSDLQFFKTPLLIDRGLVEVAINSSMGPLRCTIDTGASVSMFNTDEERKQTLEEMVVDPKNLVKLTLSIEGANFDEVEFVSIPIKSPIPIEAILGMTFLREHLVFLDFYEGYAYFAKKL